MKSYAFCLIIKPRMKMRKKELFIFIPSRFRPSRHCCPKNKFPGNRARATFENKTVKARKPNQVNPKNTTKKQIKHVSILLRKTYEIQQYVFLASALISLPTLVKFMISPNLWTTFFLSSVHPLPLYAPPLCERSNRTHVKISLLLFIYFSAHSAWRRHILP